MIDLPPLSQRREDIPQLIRFFLDRNRSQAVASLVTGVDPVAEEILVGYHWPGNIRELENVVSRALVLADGICITPADLPSDVARSLPVPLDERGAPIPGGSLRDQMRRIEGGIIFRTLDLPAAIGATRLRSLESDYQVCTASSRSTRICGRSRMKSKAPSEGDCDATTMGGDPPAHGCAHHSARRLSPNCHPGAGGRCG